MNTKHTSGSLKIEPYTINGNMIGIGTGTHTIGAAYSADDAARIVLSWNAHDDLVAALELVSPYIKVLSDDGYLTDLAVTEFRSALAKAKG